MKPLEGRVALVAGATRGAGRGIAVELGAAGATVYATGRSTKGRPSEIGRGETIEETAALVAEAGGEGIAVRVDHLVPEEVAALVARIRRARGRLDILVNDIWGGEHLFEWNKPVWEHDLETHALHWDDRVNEIYGKPTDGKPRGFEDWAGTIHPDDLAQATRDFERDFQFNTVIAAVMELVNDAYRLAERLDGDDGERALRFATATAASLIFPFAPHLGAEVWEAVAGGRVWEEPWPVADPELLVRDVVTLVVQVNGKLRDRVEVPAGAGEEEVLAAVGASARIQEVLDGREPVKSIVVPDRLVNLFVP